MIDRVSSAAYQAAQISLLKTAMDLPKMALVLLESTKIDPACLAPGPSAPPASPKGVGTKIDIYA